MKAIMILFTLSAWVFVLVSIIVVLYREYRASKWLQRNFEHLNGKLEEHDTFLYKCGRPVNRFSRLVPRMFDWAICFNGSGPPNKLVCSINMRHIIEKFAAGKWSIHACIARINLIGRQSQEVKRKLHHDFWDGVNDDVC